MRVRFKEKFSVLVFATGLAVGPAAHRIQHCIEHARARGDADTAARTLTDDVVLSRSLPTGSFEETICILCEVLDGQAALAPTMGSMADPHTAVPVTGRRVVLGEGTNRPRGRAPPPIA